MFAKCLNMMKNENVLLDPNSEALWGAVGVTNITQAHCSHMQEPAGDEVQSRCPKRFSLENRAKGIGSAAKENYRLVTSRIVIQYRIFLLCQSEIRTLVCRSGDLTGNDHIALGKISATFMKPANA